MSGKAKAKKFPVILLAGGNGSRLGGPKGLLERNGRPWLAWQLGQLAERGLSRTVIVLGHHPDAYFAALPWLKDAVGRWSANGGIEVAVAVNEAPERGQFSSIQCGARFLAGSGSASEGAYLIPVDVPCPSQKVWDALAGALKKNKEVCMPLWQGRGGHPVLLAGRFLGKILDVSVDASGARLDAQIHEVPGGDFAGVEVDDPSVRVNINTPADWRTIA